MNKACAAGGHMRLCLHGKSLNDCVYELCSGYALPCCEDGLKRALPLRVAVAFDENGTGQPVLISLFWRGESMQDVAYPSRLHEIQAAGVQRPGVPPRLPAHGRRPYPCLEVSCVVPLVIVCRLFHTFHDPTSTPGPSRHPYSTLPARSPPTACRVQCQAMLPVECVHLSWQLMNPHGLSNACYL